VIEAINSHGWSRYESTEQLAVGASVLAGPEMLGLRGAIAEGAEADRFVAGLQRFDTPSSTLAGQFEIEQTGPYNYRVPGGGTAIDIDGYVSSTVLDAKFIRDPAKSPYVNGSDVPQLIREKVLEQQEYEMQRYKAINLILLYRLSGLKY